MIRKYWDCSSYSKSLSLIVEKMVGHLFESQSWGIGVELPPLLACEHDIGPNNFTLFVCLLWPKRIIFSKVKYYDKEKENEPFTQNSNCQPLQVE